MMSAMQEAASAEQGFIDQEEAEDSDESFTSQQLNVNHSDSESEEEDYFDYETH